MKIKMFMLGVTAAVVLAACGEGAVMESSKAEETTTAAAASSAETEAASNAAESSESESNTAEETTAEASQATTEAAIALSEKVKMGTPVLLEGGTAELDLDQDGNKEKIQFTATADDYELTVNDVVTQGTGWSLTGEIYALSMDGSTVELLIPEDGPSDDPLIYVYGYDNGGMKLAGTLATGIHDISVADGKINCRELSNIFQTVGVSTQYKYEKHTLISVDLGFYKMNNTVTALMEIPAYDEKNGEEGAVVISEGSSVKILGTDNKEWIEIEDIASGKTGWLKLAPDTYSDLEISGAAIPSTVCFDGIILAG